MANPIGDCFNIDYVNKRVYNNQTYTDIFTTRQLYSYLQDQFDDLSQMDDTIPMSAQTPTNYTLINGWFMDDVSFKYLEGGAIETNGWANEIQIIKLDGVGTDPVSTDIGKQVRSGGSTNIGPLLAYEIDPYGADTGKWWVRTGSGTAITNNTALDIPTGSTAEGDASEDSLDGECLWPNVYTLGSIMEDGASGFKQQIYIAQSGSRIFSGSEWWPKGGNDAATRHIDVLIKIKEVTEIDNGYITVYLRHYPGTLPARANADLYDHFAIDLSGGGRNAVPLATSPDLNNTTDDGTVSTYNDIDVAFVNGTISYSAVSGAYTEFETVTGSTSGATGVFLYQTTTTGAGIMTLGNVVGTFQNGEDLTSATRSATSSATLTEGHTMLKNFTQQSSYNYSVIIDCANRTVAQVYEYLKFITRIGNTFTMYPTTLAANGTTRTHTSAQGQLYIRAHEDLQATPTEPFSPVKASPFGTFAGGKFFGAQGVWIQNMASTDVQAFQLIDSGGTTRTPPVSIAISVTNTLACDRVAVFRTTGGEGSTSIWKEQFTASGSNNTTGSSTFTVAEAIPSDTPATGSVRIIDTSDYSNSREVRYSYTSWSGSAFSLSATLGKTYTASEDKAYVPYIDSEATTTSVSVTVIYSANSYVLTRVRRYATTAILPFQVTGQVTSGGYSQGTIRTDDTIVLH